VLLLGVLLLAVLLAALPACARADGACRPGARAVAKVELYMGVAGRPEDWRRFLAQVVTPRFPEGLTALEGQGQWHGRRGVSHEATRVLVIFYAPDATSDSRIEAIRSLYKRRFRQQSVLRADTTACVSF
jgi:Protein of unknown function (DUF3574)